MGGAPQPRPVLRDRRSASPSPIPSRRASSGESSTCWRATVNLSAGEISTSGAAQIERYVPSRRAPFEAARAVRVGGAAARPCPRTPRPRPRRRDRRRRHLRGHVELGPPHAAPADRLERDPAVERDRLDELRERHRRGQHAGVEPGAPARSRRSPTSRRGPSRGGRSRSAAAAGGRRGGRPCRPSRRRSRPGRSRWRARRAPRSGPRRARPPARRGAARCSHRARSGRSRIGSVWNSHSAVISPSTTA